MTLGQAAARWRKDKRKEGWGQSRTGRKENETGFVTLHGKMGGEGGGTALLVEHMTEKSGAIVM